MELPPFPIWVQSLIGFLFYLIGLAFYRLYWSPIAKFPGSKLAALTLWYEFYYDVIQRGRYSSKIAEMHKQYGPIIRINPYEIHIDDPDFIDEVYVGPSRRTDKYAWAMVMFGLDNTSSVSTINHNLHRIRRAAVAPFFSTSSVQKLEPIIRSIILKAISKLHGTHGSGTPVNLVTFYSALTGDIISEYAFGRSLDNIERPDFAAEWHQMWMDLSEMGHFIKQFPRVTRVLQAMPLWLVKVIKPTMPSFIEIKKRMKDHVLEVKTDLTEGRKTNQKTIFYDILSNGKIRPEEKENSYLICEAQTVIGAGTLTTAHMLCTLTFHLLDNPLILQKLQHELMTISEPKWQQLEKLPYLTAVINEGLRMGYGVTHRLQRLFPEVALQYHEWKIPTNTPVSMTATLVHDNETLFPDHKRFNPDRWLQPSSHQLEKYLIPFSKGSRGCLGMNLARCELFLTIAMLFTPGQYKLRLFETNVTDVEPWHDFFNPAPKTGSKGIRVMVE